MDLKISQLPAITAATSNTLLPVVESGITSKITKENFLQNSYAQCIGYTDQTLPSNSATTVNLDIIGSTTDISLNSNTITFSRGGTYLISASYQFSQGSGAADVAFWFKKNTSEIPYSATHVNLTSNNKHTAMITTIETFDPGDTLQLRIQSTSSNTKIDNIDSSGLIPDAPGIILTMNKIY